VAKATSSLSLIKPKFANTPQIAPPMAARCPVTEYASDLTAAGVKSFGESGSTPPAFKRIEQQEIVTAAGHESAKHRIGAGWQ